MHPYWWYPFPFFLLGFLFIFLLFRFVLFRGRCGWDRGMDADSILKRRLASGQITEDEFQRLRRIMKDAT